MPCTFDPYDRRRSRDWRSSDNRLTPASNEEFHVITGLVGGGCGHCRANAGSIAWGSMRYVLCLNCAQGRFNAPDLRRLYPEIFDGNAEPYDEDANYEEAPDMLITKRDKDFDPRKYKRYVHAGDLSDRHGCAGYRCATYSAPHRTIPANAPFMLGEGQRGHLCMECFAKLKEKWDALPTRIICSYCDRRVPESRMREVMHWRDSRVCASCLQEYFIHCPETDGGYVPQEGVVYAQTIATEGEASRRVYASPRYAERNWFMGRDTWYMTEEQADREMFQVDTYYRDRKIAEHQGHTIFSYGTNVIKMYGFPEVTPKDSLCYGVELEMQPNARNTHEKLVEVLGGKYVANRAYILCRDSSIGAAGVEMITLPYTLANHKSDKYMPWAKLLAELRKVGQSGQNNTQCGMHVHINRRALSHLQMGKMLVVINAPEMQELIATIAQRSEASYCRRYFKKVADGGKIIGSHGDALNCSNGKGTLELRIFRGNLRYERVMKNLEFTDALCNYANEQSIQKVHLPDQMVSWINDNRSHYPHLAKFIAEEYQPTKAFMRTAAKARASSSSDAWSNVVSKVHVEPTEGDI